jgi:hypothetical protein
MVDEYIGGRRIDEDTGRHYDPKGEESVAAMRKRLIDNFPGGKWDDVVKKAQAAFGADAKVVPVEGVYRFLNEDGEALTFNDVIPLSCTWTSSAPVDETGYDPSVCSAQRSVSTWCTSPSLSWARDPRAPPVVATSGLSAPEHVF